MDVVSKAFTEKAAPELGSKRDKICQMGRDKYGSDGGNCMNNSVKHNGRWCFGKMVMIGKDFPQVSLFCMSCRLIRSKTFSQMWREV